MGILFDWQKGQLRHLATTCLSPFFEHFGGD